MVAKIVYTYSKLRKNVENREKKNIFLTKLVLTINCDKDN